jgi:predicted MPP superfamily phosphohydrolase
VDARVMEIADSHVSELRHLRARDGVYFVTGNHEYYWGGREWIEFVGRLGVRVLMNERVALGDARRSGAQFDLAGIPDYRAGQRHPVAPDPSAACSGRDPERELVMLAHQPIQIFDTARVGAGLQLSGHTHGGQINPFGAVLALASQPYFAGLHRHPGGDTQVYVSRGSGFWGPPMRVLAPAEITRIRLYRA